MSATTDPTNNSSLYGWTQQRILTEGLAFLRNQHYNRYNVFSKRQQVEELRKATLEILANQPEHAETLRKINELAQYCLHKFDTKLIPERSHSCEARSQAIDIDTQVEKVKLREYQLYIIAGTSIIAGLTGLSAYYKLKHLQKSCSLQGLDPTELANCIGQKNNFYFNPSFYHAIIVAVIASTIIIGKEFIYEKNKLEIKQKTFENKSNTTT